MLAKALQGATAAADKLYIEDVMSTYLYTGNGSTQTITNGIDLSGKGGFVWIKGRTDVGGTSAWGGNIDHALFDTARGMDRNSFSRVLSSNRTDAQAQLGAGGAGALSTGFDLGYNGYDDINFSGNTYASWTFRKQAKFFDVVTWTGSGANRTIAHNLGSVPGCIIVKRTDTAADWQVYHRSLANTEYLVLNSTAAKATGTTRWNSTTPTSTVFSLGTDATVNASGGTYVAYLFAHDAGGFGDSGNDSVVKCGNSTSTQRVELGWEPQWMLIKNTTTTGDWWMFDSMRGLTAVNGAQLKANLSDAESAGWDIQIDSTGFTTGVNGVPGTPFIYIAIRRGPMKKPTDATKVFAVDLGLDAGTSSTPNATAGFPVDMGIITSRTSADNRFIASRLTAGNVMYTEGTFAENVNSIWSFSYQNGFATFGAANPDRFAWMFRRAPGFFDVVAYTGTGIARTVSHNLGVVPELMIVKSRSSGPAAPNWWVYCSAMPTPETSYLTLESTGSRASGVTVLWNSTNPTSSGFSLGTYSGVNGSTYTYIAYLFATCPGVSKVGSYTGTGTTLSVDCGFTNGSRLVLIKRTDSTGSWYIWDSARGIVSGNDPYLLLNSTAAEVTNTDYIDPLSSGFQISSTAPAAINANGGSYIYLSVA